MTSRTPSTKAFRLLVYRQARCYHRDLPWRRTCSPYRILVSEIMLQQTQVERVVPKYRAFLKQFPTLKTLAHAPLREVLISWQELGYNRRAKMLHSCAKEVVARHRGTLPRTHRELTALPGIGPYTAGAVLAFAYNLAHPVIETNIRTVYLHHYFPGQKHVTERELMKKVVTTLDECNARAWYTALMDYGTYLKKQVGNQNTRSQSYVKQSKFSGSSRQLRGAIVRTLAQKSRCTTAALARNITAKPKELDAQLAALKEEGLITKRGASWSLAS